MLIPISLLKQYLDTDADTAMIAQTLTNIGLEVEGITDYAEIFAPFTIAHINETAQHPDADRLKVCQVDIGGQIKEIVCGAPNARAGIKVIYAPIGTYIPGSDITLKKSKIRGIESMGMLCSLSELNLGEDSEGIAELDKGNIGEKFADVYGHNDAIIDIAITPNRADCFSMLGVARDLAAAGIGALKPTADYKLAENGASNLNLHIHASDDCAILIGRRIAGITNAQSPVWLQSALTKAGLKPVSAAVDVTNYVAHMIGQPLHAFDAAKVANGLQVDTLKQDIGLELLDGKTYTLPQGALTINSAEEVLSLAGIMGGMASSCDENTTDIILEAAWFNPESIAKTGQATNITSDARTRFERGVDRNIAQYALDMATSLILDICGGAAQRTETVGAPASNAATITYDWNLFQAYTGIDLDQSVQAKILRDLDFVVDGNNITLPSWRFDMSCKADVVEEILRIHGINKLEATPLPARSAVKLSQTQATLTKVLAGRGLTEAVTWSFCDSKLADHFGGQDDALKLISPISNDLDVMRPSLLPNLLKTACMHINHNIETNGLFEAAARYHPDLTLNQEQTCTWLRLGTEKRHWQSNVPSPSIYDIKADLAAILPLWGLSIDKLQHKDAPDYYHPGQSAALYMGKNHVATIGALHPKVLKAFDINQPVYAAEVFLDRLPNVKIKGATKKPFTPSPYPAVHRDLAFVLPRHTKAMDVVKLIRQAAKTIIQDVSVFDVYTGQHVADDEMSMAFALTFKVPDRTLTDDEVEQAVQAMITSVRDNASGRLR